MEWKLYTPAMPPRSGVQYLVQCVGTHSRERYLSIAEFEPINFNWHTPLDQYPLVVTHYVEITGVKDFEDEHGIKDIIDKNVKEAKAQAAILAASQASEAAVAFEAFGVTTVAPNVHPWNGVYYTGWNNSNNWKSPK